VFADEDDLFRRRQNAQLAAPAKLKGELAEDLVAESVERSDDRVVQPNRGVDVDALLHLGGGTFGEGDGQDLVRFRGARGDEMNDARGQNMGLPRPSARDHEQGSGTVLVAGGANRFPYVLFVTDEIKRVEDLRGKKFGVSRIGSADNAAAITVLNRFGIKETDVTYVQAGSIPARLAAMQTNALQATLLQAPETLKAKEIGMRALLDFTKLDVEWQQNGVAVTRDYIKKKPDTVRRFLRAYVEGSHYNLTNAKGAQKILQKYLAIKDEKSVEEAYNEIVAKLTRRVPYPTEPGIQLFLDQLKAKNPKAAQAKPSDFTDVSFLKELESSGYIDKLYK